MRCFAEAFASSERLWEATTGKILRQPWADSPQRRAAVEALVRTTSPYFSSSPRRPGQGNTTSRPEINRRAAFETPTPLRSAAAPPFLSCSELPLKGSSDLQREGKPSVNPLQAASSSWKGGWKRPSGRELLGATPSGRLGRMVSNPTYRPSARTDLPRSFHAGKQQAGLRARCGRTEMAVFMEVISFADNGASRGVLYAHHCGGGS